MVLLGTSGLQSWAGPQRWVGRYAQYYPVRPTRTVGFFLFFKKKKKKTSTANVFHRLVRYMLGCTDSCRRWAGGETHRLIWRAAGRCVECKWIGSARARLVVAPDRSEVCSLVWLI